jgi:hypothetical protein
VDQNNYAKGGIQKYEKTAFTCKTSGGTTPVGDKSTARNPAYAGKHTKM